MEKTQTVKKNSNLSPGVLLISGFCNAGSCVIFATVASLITLFYTDYVGISPGIIATVMLLSRFLDGFSDIVAGFLIQRTRTRFGQARPWILGISLPLLISCVACFTVPKGSDTMTFWYVFISYNLANTVCFTVSDLAQCSLVPLMTRDSAEREKISVWRMGLCPIGHILAAGCSLPLVKMLGNDQAAWIKVMFVWGMFGLITHVLCFLFCKETVQIEAAKKKNHNPISVELKGLFGNRYWWWMMFFWVLWGTYFSLTGTTMSYYTRYILGNDGLYTVFFILEKVLWGVGIIFIVPVLRKKGFRRRTLMTAGCLMVMAAHLILILAPESVPLNTAVVAIRGLSVAPLGGFFNGVLADVAEYGQWKTHLRQESLICSASSMGYKVGCGVIMAGVTALLGVAGFVTSTTGGAAQPDSALIMVKNLYIWAPAAVFALEAFICSRYRLDEQLPGIMEELQQRELQGEL